ncbi:uncharacterized protein LOC119650387 isoform X2 [Hermetia illucens]|uniref:uncharacterized protein LOC119650387 isoform X2 n=1 Tax=Hermetia illucens TaxID=343691 RepID=UPI0018CC50C8|nr:uncharacterized protein LOC119650387 isoform X2 [Hermetia illucens]
MVKFGHILVVTIVALVGASVAEKHVRLIPDSYETWSDNVYLNFTYAMDTSAPHINITHKVMKTIPEIEAHIESEIHGKNNPDHFFRSNATFSVCDILSLKAASPVTAFIFATVKRHGSLPEKCPIEPGTYGISKFWYPEENIPTNVPEIEAEFKVQLFAIDNGQRHIILNNRLKGHSAVVEGSA